MNANWMNRLRASQPVTGALVTPTTAAPAKLNNGVQKLLPPMFRAIEMHEMGGFGNDHQAPNRCVHEMSDQHFSVFGTRPEITFRSDDQREMKWT